MLFTFSRNSKGIIFWGNSERVRERSGKNTMFPHTECRMSKNEQIIIILYSLHFKIFGIFVSVADIVHVMYFVLCSSLIFFFFSMCVCVVRLRPIFFLLHSFLLKCHRCSLRLYMCETSKLRDSNNKYSCVWWHKKTTRKMSWVEISIRFVSFQLFASLLLFSLLISFFPKQKTKQKKNTYKMCFEHFQTNLDPVCSD